jgi:hypothetical protein
VIRTQIFADAVKGSCISDGVLGPFLETVQSPFTATRFGALPTHSYVRHQKQGPHPEAFSDMRGGRRTGAVTCITSRRHACFCLVSQACASLPGSSWVNSLLHPFRRANQLTQVATFMLHGLFESERAPRWCSERVTAWALELRGAVPESAPCEHP